MRYEDASDTRPQYAWYGRSLWIYDVATSDGAEVLRFDAHTGALLQRTAMPEVYRPVMVANGDGLWLDPATNGGIGGVNVVPVLHVAFGASKPVVVHRGGRAAMWMTASAHRCGSSRSRAARASRSGGSTARRCGSSRDRGRSASRAPTAGGKLWELTCGVKEHLLRIDPDTGAPTPVGQFPRIVNYCDASMTVVAGDVFVLEGQKLYVYG